MIQNTDAEFRILDAILANNSILHDADLSPDDFTDPEHRSVFGALSYSIDRGKTADLPFLIHCQSTGKFNVSDRLLSSLEGLTAANAEFYIQKVKQASKQRKLKALSPWIADQVEADPDVTLEALQGKITAIFQNGTEALQTSATVTPGTLKEIETLFHKKGELYGLPTGYGRLDGITNGLIPGELIIIAARTSAGKTAFALNLVAKQVFIRGLCAGFISLEMDLKSIHMRLMSNLAGIPLSRIRSGRLNDADFQSLLTTADKLNTDKLIYYRAKNSGLAHIKAKIRQMVLRGAQIVYVDYLTLISHPDTRLSRPERVGMTSKELKMLAEELHIPIVALSQLGRQAAGKEPHLSDLRQSGELEEDSDKVILLQREIGKSETVLKVGKNRNGATGVLYFDFNQETQRFDESESPP